MKKVFLITLIIVVILLGYHFIKKNRIDSLVVDNVQVKSDIMKVEEKMKDGKLGSMTFKYPEDAIITQDKFPFFDLNINIFSVAVDGYKENKYVKNYTPLNFYVSKNESPKNISMEEWLDLNAPYKDKGSPYLPINSGVTKIDGNNAIYMNYHVSDYRIGGFYDLKILYIFHNNYVYEIESYTISSLIEERDLSLNEREKENLQNYEKIVDQIIQSIRFVD